MFHLNFLITLNLILKEENEIEWKIDAYSALTHPVTFLCLQCFKMPSPFSFKLNVVLKTVAGFFFSELYPVSDRFKQNVLAVVLILVKQMQFTVNHHLYSGNISKIT